MLSWKSSLQFALLSLSVCSTVRAADDRVINISVTIDRGRDLGQNFGSLFEALSDDGKLVVGAGFQGLYNTQFRADRHAIQFYVRPTDGKRAFTLERLPRPNNLCGTYLYSRDEAVYSTYGTVRAWNQKTHEWRDVPGIGSSDEAMRVGNALLEFGNSTVKYRGKTILNPPSAGSYQRFFYAHGHLCFYHVNRGDAGYRLYQRDSGGFSKLHACPWTPGQDRVDLARAIIHTLPVVGETTFAWGQFAKQIVTGSNIGGFYIFEDGAWRMLLKPNLAVSYQLYSTAVYHDRLLMGQYPTGRLFEYDGKKITDLAGWPPKLDGVSGSAREAQTTVIYGGDLFVGVWPWGELWRYNPDSKAWAFERRMFDHPSLSDKIVHPYDIESRDSAVKNLWGQRVTSLVTSGPDLFISTSAKWPAEWDAKKFPFLAPEKWKSYGSVYRLTMPGHLGAATKWTDGPTKMEFIIRGSRVSITQDGEPLAAVTLTGPLAERLTGMTRLKNLRWGDGIYGRFSGKAMDGVVKVQ
ncbi:MAG: hypothetical protein FJ303_23595 [Planctomycetes bacterium]|nr:hypothetical protein [Planctomycetota bacterium]